MTVTHAELSQLRNYIDTQVREVARDIRKLSDVLARLDVLETAFAALVERLAADHGLDAATLAETISRTANTGPFSAEHPQPRPPGTVTCVRCYHAIPRERTAITEQGEVCDPSCAV
jgi:hypothetical protein